MLGFYVISSREVKWKSRPQGLLTQHFKELFICSTPFTAICTKPLCKHILQDLVLIFLFLNFSFFFFREGLVMREKWGYRRRFSVMKQKSCKCTNLDHLLPAYWWECQMELNQKQYWLIDYICCFPFSAWLATLTEMKIKWLGTIYSSHRHKLLLRALFLPDYWNRLFIF